MPRKRQIDPGIWTSHDFTERSLRQRMLFIGLISLSDDYGRGRAEPSTLRAQVFPADEYRASDIQDDRDALAAAGMVRLFQIDGRVYYELPTWRTYQKVDHPSQSSIPIPKKENYLSSRVIRESFANQSRKPVSGECSSLTESHCDDNIPKEGQERESAPGAASKAIREPLANDSRSDRDPIARHRVEEGRVGVVRTAKYNSRATPISGAETVTASPPTDHERNSTAPVTQSHDGTNGNPTLDPAIARKREAFRAGVKALRDSGVSAKVIDRLADEAEP
jgi:hypothetical protein